ncbi:MAG: YajD family HNH nuclease [Gammaproteobacteria bacterium]|nr:YajD family HNH nuclease [Gammaproteobacteria bacterium]
MSTKNTKFDQNKRDQIIRDALKDKAEREKGYREQALKMYPWVCGRCSREFTHKNLRELTVHHRDHNHDNNPPDGSNWELLCLYCHDNEHARFGEYSGNSETGPGREEQFTSTHNPFAGLKNMLDEKE